MLAKKTQTKTDEVKEETKDEKPECFVIMPISDPDGYEPGHFKHVYDNIIRPACVFAGYSPVRVDEGNETNLIQVDILNRLINAPIAVCDLSNHNPNVLFELGIRQAFDKPTVLIQEKGTKPIFDIANIRVYSYCKEMIYHNTVIDQENVRLALKDTSKSINDKTSQNSIVSLMSLNAAKLPNNQIDQETLEIRMLRDEIKSIKSIIENINQSEGWQRLKTTSNIEPPSKSYHEISEKSKAVVIELEALNIIKSIDSLNYSIDNSEINRTDSERLFESLKNKYLTLLNIQREHNYKSDYEDVIGIEIMRIDRKINTIKP